MYQRGRIQEESLEYEQKKNSGELPVIGVNTFRNEHEGGEEAQGELIRSSDDEKRMQIDEIAQLHSRFADEGADALAELKRQAKAGENLFAALMEAVKVCSLGQISQALYDVGGAYRRSM